jgi:hypothetical protein
MQFKVEPKGWGINIEADYEGAHFLANFIQTKRIAPHEESAAFNLYTQLNEALMGAKWVHR